MKKIIFLFILIFLCVLVISSTVSPSMQNIDQKSEYAGVPPVKVPPVPPPDQR